jgi:hypothetical protein
MNQQTSYSLKASILEYKKNNQTSNSEDLVLPTNTQNTPDVVELTRIMLGVISEENARKMTLDERHAFYNITDGLLALTYQLN